MLDRLPLGFGARPWPGVSGTFLLGLPLLASARLLGFGVLAWVPDLTGLLSLRVGLLSLELGALDQFEGRGDPGVLQRPGPGVGAWGPLM